MLKTCFEIKKWRKTKFTSKKLLRRSLSKSMEFEVVNEYETKFGELLNFQMSIVR